MNPITRTGKLFRFLWKRSSRPEEGQRLYGPLEDSIGHRFSNESLLTHALTHKSRTGGEDRKGLLSNERLEFLGDAVLNVLVTDYLYQSYPQCAEGHLSKMKSLVVSRKILAEVGTGIKLGQYLILGASEKKTGGQKRRSLISNAFEAVLGAIYLDSDIVAARHCLERLLFPRIEEFVNDERHVNHKSKILEMAQADGFGIPRYSVISTTGPEHAKNFTVHIEIAGVVLGEGTGGNKKVAQQKAAEKAVLNYDKDMIISQRKGATEDELLSE